MSTGFQLGPLSLSWGMLIFFVAVFSALSVGERVARKLNVPLKGQLYIALAVGIIAARLAFVLQFSDAYLDDPIRIIDIRDGGWHVLVGFAALWVYVAGVALRLPIYRKPLISAAATATVLWAIGAALLSFLSPRVVPLPAFNSTLLDGAPVAITDFKGKPTVINLWATWCPPCVREMPVLQRAQQDYPDVNVVFINQGEPVKTIRRFMDQHALSLQNVVLDPRSETSVMLKQRGMPSTLFFDKNGVLVDTRLGELSQATLMQRLGRIRDAEPLPSGQGR